jgi:cobalt-zinc-cadmium efflux system outer membrane protein
LDGKEDFMRVLKRLVGGLLVATALGKAAFAQRALTWQEVRDKFEAANPTLQAGQIGIEENRAEEITAYLRPNPSASLLTDQLYPFYTNAFSGTKGTAANIGYRPFENALVEGTLSYLHERQHKRELRLESAQGATKVAESDQADLERTLIFNLRAAFVQTLQQKAILQLAKDNLDYYDHFLQINSDRYKAGAIARIDLSRLQLQRVQYESDLQTAEVDLRTAKIQLLALLNDRTPIDQFDVSGSFDFSNQTPTLVDVHQAALDTRPDLRAAIQSVDKAKTDHRLAVANGSTDPTFSVDAGSNPPLDPYVGFGISIPLRVFDRNQGEKQRTQLDIDRNAKLVDATRAQVFSDVDSAYAAVKSSVILLQPYKDTYLSQATDVRDTIEFSYEHGGASLLDFLNAQADYRSVQANYLTLVGSYLNAAAQLNLAAGREVIP